MSEVILGALAALGAAAGLFWKLWRGQAAKTKAAQQEVKAVREVARHEKRAQAASEQARMETEKAVEEVRQEVRKGRRDHFEGQ